MAAGAADRVGAAEEAILAGTRATDGTSLEEESSVTGRRKPARPLVGVLRPVRASLIGRSADGYALPAARRAVETKGVPNA